MMSLRLKTIAFTILLGFLTLFGTQAAFAQTCTTNAGCTGGRVCVSGTCQAEAVVPGNTGETVVPGNTGGSAGPGETLVNPLKVDSLDGLLRLVLDAVIQLGTIVLVLMLVWVGFMFVTARGNEERLRTARAAFFWTIIGGLILLGARGIAEVVQSTATSL